MMRMSNIKMTTTVGRTKLLATLRTNLARHASIVQEARNGYIEKARIALENRLEKLRRGKIVSLSFSLTPPADYSEVYRSAIQMLEWNSAEMVELQADEFRQLVLDQWDWTNSFLVSNSLYSKSASDIVAKQDAEDEVVGGSFDCSNQCEDR